MKTYFLILLISLSFSNVCATDISGGRRVSVGHYADLLDSEEAGSGDESEGDSYPNSQPEYGRSDSPEGWVKKAYPKRLAVWRMLTSRKHRHEEIWGSSYQALRNQLANDITHNPGIRSLWLRVGHNYETVRDNYEVLADVAAAHQTPDLIFHASDLYRKLIVLDELYTVLYARRYHDFFKFCQEHMCWDLLKDPHSDEKEHLKIFLRK